MSISTSPLTDAGVGGEYIELPILDLLSTIRPRSRNCGRGVGSAALGMGITPIARVTSHDPHDATRILDCGAQG